MRTLVACFSESAVCRLVKCFPHAKQTCHRFVTWPRFLLEVTRCFPLRQVGHSIL